MDESDASFPTLQHLARQRVVGLVGECSVHAIGPAAWCKLSAPQWSLVLSLAAAYKLLTDDVLVALAAAPDPPALAELKLAGAGGHLTGVGVAALASCEVLCSSLRALDLSRCIAVPPDALCTLLKRCTGLQRLVLLRTTAATDEVLCSLPPSLEALDVTRSTRVTDKGLCALAASPCSATLVTAVLDACPGISGAGVEQLVASCPCLSALSIARGRRVTPNALLPALSTPARALTVLNISRCRNITHTILEPLACAICDAPTLTYLDLSSSGVGQGGEEATRALEAFFAAIEPSRPPLGVLYLSDCRAVTDRVVVALAGALDHSLRRLYLSECSELSSWSLALLLQCCESLQVLNIAKCTRVDDTTFCGPIALPPMPPDEASDLVARFYDALERPFALPRTLQTLNLSHCSNLTPRTTKALAQLPSLGWIEASNCVNMIDDDGLLALAQPSLHSLDITHCTHLTGACFDELGRRFCRDGAPFRWLMFAQTEVGAEPLSRFLSQCHSLQILNMSSCASVTVQVLETVLEQCPVLSRLDACRCAGLDTDAPGDANDAPLHTSPHKHRMLETVNITGRGCLRAEVLAMPTRMPNLKSLSFSGAANLTDAHVEHILRGCPDMQYLNLAMCGGVGDGTVNAAAQLAPRLATLIMGGCSRITDVSVANLLRTSTVLVDLDLTGCGAVTAASIAQLAQAEVAPNLLSLALTGCDVSSGLVHRIGLERKALTVTFKRSKQRSSNATQKPEQPPNARRRTDQQQRRQEDQDAPHQTAHEQDTS